MKVRRTLLLGVFCAVVSGAMPAMAAPKILMSLAASGVTAWR